MKSRRRGTRIGSSILLALAFVACEKEIRNITPESPEPSSPAAVVITPVDINVDGFDLLEKMQGHWVGMNRVIAFEYDWFAFDYRPISPSHVFGIFEGGSLGNLFTSFFASDYKGTRTIMARNGGLLNGIYRTSYFVLDSVSTGSDGKYFRLVDAKGGTGIMYMELRFDQDSLFFNAYTSRLGLTAFPTRHMTFKAKRENPGLAQTAAATVGFPQNIAAWDFSNGFMEQYLYVNLGETEARSATFLAEADDPSDDLLTLAAESGDPFTILDHPYLAYLQVDVVRNASIDQKPLFIYLSKDPLTDGSGYFQWSGFDSILLFPEIGGSEDQFTFTYLHPGDYHVTVIADVDEDGTISTGDITHADRSITITPLGQQQITIDNINVVN